MTGAPRPFGPAALSAESWEAVFQQTLSFADYQVARLRWRGQFGGILPGGFDPNSIAAQAIMEFLQQSGENCGPRMSIFSSQGMSSVGLAKEGAAALEHILWEVKRLVLRQVTRLHHLQENWLLSNEADLALVRDQDGDPVTPLELLPAPDVQPDEALMRKESFIEYNKLRFRFQVSLAKERRLITLFGLNCDGISKPQALAARLKLGVRTIESLQRRLRRKWLAFSHLQSPANRRPKPEIFTAISI